MTVYRLRDYQEMQYSLEQPMKAQKWKLDGRGSIPRPAHFISEEETRYPLNRMLSEAQGRSGRVLKILPPQGFDARTVQPVGGREYE